MSWWLAPLVGVPVAAPWAPWALRRLRRALHILQLEEYQNRRTLHWAARHWLADSQPAIVAGLTCLFTIFVIVALLNLGRPSAVLAVAFAGAGLGVIKRPPDVAPKKPLLVTARVKRLIAALALVDLLLAGVLLMAGQALGAAAQAALLIAPALIWLAVAVGPLPVIAANLLAWPFEAANRRRYRRVAKARLRAVCPRIVAITGSYGKTTTKELVATVLESRYRVLKTPRSFNTPMGITRTIREELKDDHEVFVVEMGAYKPGNIRDLCRFVGPPEVSAIVGINEQHLERMGSIQNTVRAKYEIVEATRPGGLAVFNVDNPYCAGLAAKTDGVRVARVGGPDHEQAPDLWADGVTVTPKLMKFVVHDGDQKITVRTRLLGRHLIPNFLIALAIGKEMGVDLRDAAAKLATAQPVGHRLNVSETNGTIVIDDAYSANVDGARAALGLLAELPAARRFLVTPGIVELGPVEEQRNREFGARAAEVCTRILVVGETPGRYVREGALAAGMKPAQVVACPDLAAAQAHLLEAVQPGDAVLFENDLPDNYA